jgi:hypothetical protein
MTIRPYPVSAPHLEVVILTLSATKGKDPLLHFACAFAFAFAFASAFAFAFAVAFAFLSVIPVGNLLLGICF